MFEDRPIDKSGVTWGTLIPIQIGNQSLLFTVGEITQHLAGPIWEVALRRAKEAKRRQAAVAMKPTGQPSEAKGGRQQRSGNPKGARASAR